jgi:hypothetical protein
VSAVDSGNLAGHLLVTESGLRGLVDAPALPARFIAGLTDTATMARDLARGKGDGVGEATGATASATITW